MWEDAPAQTAEIGPATREGVSEGKMSSKHIGDDVRSQPHAGNQGIDVAAAATEAKSLVSTPAIQAGIRRPALKRVVVDQDAPDMSGVGQKSMKASFHRCNACKIKVPSVDIPMREKPCNFCKNGTLQQLGEDGKPVVAPAELDIVGSGSEEGLKLKENDDATSVKADTIMKRALTLKGDADIPLLINLSEYDNICGDGSVWKKILKVGSGFNPPIRSNVAVHYVGKLPDTGVTFDTSRKRSTLFVFQLGSGVIQGWIDGVITMKKGETAAFLIQPTKAYGTNGSPSGGIPPNAALYFEIELLDWMTEEDALRIPRSSKEPKRDDKAETKAKSKVEPQNQVSTKRVVAGGANQLSTCQICVLGIFGLVLAVLTSWSVV